MLYLSKSKWTPRSTNFSLGGGGGAVAEEVAAVGVVEVAVAVE